MSHQHRALTHIKFDDDGQPILAQPAGPRQRRGPTHVHFDDEGNPIAA